MSTRCQVCVIEEGFSGERRTLYHHCDGYPTNMLPLIAGGFDGAAREGWRLGRAGHCAAFLCAADPTGFEPEDGHGLHGDIEWYYKLFAVNKQHGSLAEEGRWEIEVYRPSRGGTPEHPGRLVLGRMEIHEAASKAEDFERDEEE